MNNPKTFEESINKEFWNNPEGDEVIQALNGIYDIDTLLAYMDSNYIDPSDPRD